MTEPLDEGFSLWRWVLVFFLLAAACIGLVWGSFQLGFQAGREHGYRQSQGEKDGDRVLR